MSPYVGNDLNMALNQDTRVVLFLLHSTEDDDNMDARSNGGYGNSPLDRHEKFKMVYRRWEELYDYEGSKKLNSA